MLFAFRLPFRNQVADIAGRYGLLRGYAAVFAMRQSCVHIFESICCTSSRLSACSQSFTLALAVAVPRLVVLLDLRRVSFQQIDAAFQPLVSSPLICFAGDAGCSSSKRSRSRQAQTAYVVGQLTACDSNGCRYQPSDFIVSSALTSRFSSCLDQVS